MHPRLTETAVDRPVLALRVIAYRAGSR